ncbi:hypothetical protein [Sulfobacillus thermosulfidooxidans]|uniref:hypothetical protein n=1 Tax=Sulfobacillus thermosulfidooxidans TaxID=28034 RepID=UPI0006B5710B|nr:hypothetical protein [Sulfobacillus thermosulfidooxidans]
MKRWWWIGFGVMAIAIMIIAAIIHQNSMVPVTRWATANPLIRPQHSQAMSLASPLEDQTETISLPPHHLDGTDWYLPITQHSHITYILHDGQARWIVNNHVLTLNNAPTDPVGQLIYAPNGQILAWSTPQGLVVLHANNTQTLIPHALAGYFTSHNVLDYVISMGSHLQVHTPDYTLSLPTTFTFGYHPFVFHAHAFIVDNQGHLEQYSLITGHAVPIATVRPARWPDVIDSLSYSHNIVVLLKRPTALPAYLLIVKTPHGVLWYRWQTGLKPQIGISSGHLVINNLDPSGQLVTLAHDNLHPLPQSTGLFSQSPRGIIFQTSQGFILLSHIIS